MAPYLLPVASLLSAGRASHSSLIFFIVNLKFFLLYDAMPTTLRTWTLSSYCMSTRRNPKFLRFWHLHPNLRLVPTVSTGPSQYPVLVCERSASFSLIPHGSSYHPWSALGSLCKSLQDPLSWLDRPAYDACPCLSLTAGTWTQWSIQHNICSNRHQQWQYKMMFHLHWWCPISPLPHILNYLLLSWSVSILINPPATISSMVVVLYPAFQDFRSSCPCLRHKTF